MHLAGTVTLRLILLHYLCPQQTGSTELGNLHEVVVANAHIELDALGSLCHLDTSLGKNVQVFSTPSEGITQLLIDIGTSIVQSHAVHVNALVARQLGKNLNELGSYLGTKCGGVLALGEHFANGVEVNASLQLCQRTGVLLEVSHQHLGQFHAVTLTRREVQLHILRHDTVEQGSNKLLADAVAGDLEAQRINALVQDVKSLGIGSLGICGINVLTHEPKVVVFLVAANERELSWQRIHCL